MAISYSVPDEAREVFVRGILGNQLITKNLPLEIARYSEVVQFQGSPSPSVPINWRFAESISALKALEGAVLGLLLERKYSVRPRRMVINTSVHLVFRHKLHNNYPNLCHSDHAQLFFMSPLLSTLDIRGSPIPGSLRQSTPKEDAKRFEKLFPSFDAYKSLSSHHRKSATSIYRTKEGRFFNLHGTADPLKSKQRKYLTSQLGSMNPNPTLDSIGLPHDRDAATADDAVEPFIKRLAEIDSSDMQNRASNIYKQAGTICWTVEEYQASEHGKANEHVGLFEIQDHLKFAATQKPCWWPEVPQTSSKRPLAGLKVVDMTRIIAAPAISRGLAEMGASVMRVTAEHIPDLSSLHCDLNWGKWNCFLDLRKETDRCKLRSLILEADVVVQGYRPHVLDKWGFGVNDILQMCKIRDRGIICVQENCYGWHGPWAQRSGWQQISDAASNTIEIINTVC